MAAQFEYKGFRLYVTSTGTFKVDGREDIPAADSLDKAKAAIDKALKADREPFQALMFSGDRWASNRSEGIIVVTVTSCTPTNYGAQAWIKTKGGGRSKERADHVYLNTPENRATMEKIAKLNQQREALREEARRLADTLKTIPVEGKPK